MLQKIQSSPEKHTLGRLQVPAKPSSTIGYRTPTSQIGRSNSMALSPRPQRTYTRSSSYNSRSVRGGYHEIPVPKNKSIRYGAQREILRRALTPPIRRQGRRWWDFRPTPSQLCNMSMA
ncbi:hypothetical protein Acr_00g0061320 [Actinidia rufa]|uniref:Uncharacterized protein n=1 Tax=Actinidia rufa TaxID=165716 RepID=A0A7J0DQ33_9ERIC|nr:hypothetical protein Acr_00g0061320 [Actinidia rufa]